MELDGCVAITVFDVCNDAVYWDNAREIAISLFVRILRIGFFRLDVNMVEIHVDSLAGFKQSHLHVEFHQKVIEPWVGVGSEHIAWRGLVFQIFIGEFLYGTSDGVARRCPDFRWFPQVTLASVDIFHAVTATEEHVRQGWHYLVPLIAVVGRTANTKSAVEDFVKWKRIKSA